jgi:hypothetical protein
MQERRLALYNCIEAFDFLHEVKKAKSVSVQPLGKGKMDLQENINIFGTN